MRGREVLMMAVAGVFALAASCELDDPCQEYVDYLCTCHADDPDFDCEELRTVFSDPDPNLQDQCAIDLGEQQEVDDTAGLECVGR